MVKAGNFAKVVPRVCTNWSTVINYFAHPKGRVWLVWTPSCFNVDVKLVTDQMIYSEVTHKASGLQFYLSMVYGHKRKQKEVNCGQIL